MSRVKPLEQNSIKRLPQSMLDEYFGGDPSFARMGVGGDGSCFFFSVCVALNKNNFIHLSNAEQDRVGHEFRCSFSKKLRNWNNDGMDRIQAGEAFCDPGAWAEEGMIKHASEVLRKNMVFIDATNGKLYCGVRGEEREPMILIMWIDRSHFEPVVRIVGERGDHVGIKTMFEPGVDDDVINMVMSNFQMQCGTA